PQTRSARPRRFTEFLLMQEIQTYRASRRHLRFTSRICASATVTNRNSGLKRGVDDVSQTTVAIKFQDRCCSLIARLCGILATEWQLTYCNGSPRSSTTANVSPVVASVAASPVYVCQRRMATST